MRFDIAVPLVVEWFSRNAPSSSPSGTTGRPEPGHGCVKKLARLSRPREREGFRRNIEESQSLPPEDRSPLDEGHGLDLHGGQAPFVQGRAQGAADAGA